MAVPETRLPATGRGRRIAGWMTAVAVAVTLGVAGAASLAMGQDPAPTATSDPVAALTAELKAGGAPLTDSDDGRGYLASLLKRLDIAEDSQVLVFSKTSLQAKYIDPKSPRAIYFNDRVAVGFVPGAPLIEILAMGEDGQTRFYAMPARSSKESAPAAADGCSACHVTVASPVPGPVVGSVLALETGEVSSAGENTITDARSSFESRWGGWYVTGRHGTMTHRGNSFASAGPPATIDYAAGQNVTDLSRFFDTGRYLEGTSDIVALMTLEHQVGFTALATKLNAPSDPDYIEDMVRDLVDYMVGADEEVLSAPVEGVSSFSRTFPQRGPRDAQGRSLRDFDLRTRLFRYPLSFMVYSPAFDALRPELKDMVYRRLVEVLTGQDPEGKYARFANGDGQAALEILAATKPDLPDYWPRAASTHRAEASGSDFSRRDPSAS